MRRSATMQREQIATNVEPRRSRETHPRRRAPSRAGHRQCARGARQCRRRRPTAPRVRLSRRRSTSHPCYCVRISSNKWCARCRLAWGGLAPATRTNAYPCQRTIGSGAARAEASSRSNSNETIIDATNAQVCRIFAITTYHTHEFDLPLFLSSHQLVNTTVFEILFFKIKYMFFY